jgi:hypothetical protein
LICLNEGIWLVEMNRGDKQQCPIQH